MGISSNVKKIKEGFKVLEVGSGQGEFIDLCNKNGHDAIGIELNDLAVLMAEKNNLKVFAKNLHDLAFEQSDFLIMSVLSRY